MRISQRILDMTIRLHKSRVLIGVAHTDDNLPAVLRELSGRKFTRLAVELPHDYLEKSKQGVFYDFFGPLAARYSGLGVEIIPLDEPGLVERAHEAVSKLKLAHMMLTGRTADEVLNAAAFALESKAKADSGTDAVSEESFADQVTELINASGEILLSGRGLEDYRWTMERLDAKRHEHMLSGILAHKPHIIVVGDAHARELAPMLPKYEYVRLLGSIARPDNAP